jgi:hypothetical protein
MVPARTDDGSGRKRLRFVAPQDESKSSWILVIQANVDERTVDGIPDARQRPANPLVGPGLRRRTFRAQTPVRPPSSRNRAGCRPALAMAVLAKHHERVGWVRSAMGSQYVSKGLLEEEA